MSNALNIETRQRQDLVSAFNERLEEIKATNEFVSPWVTTFFWKKDASNFQLLGGLWLPNLDLQRTISGSYVHASLIFDTERALANLGIDPFFPPNYDTINITVSPPTLALRGLIASDDNLRLQVEQDYSVSIPHRDL